MGILLLTLAILLFSLYLGFRMLINSTKEEAGSQISRVGGIVLISLTGVLFVTVIVFGTIHLTKTPEISKQKPSPELMKMMHYGPSPEFHKKPDFAPREELRRKILKERLKKPENRDKLKERLEDIKKRLEEFEEGETEVEAPPGE